jgi:hypothetical protein
MASSGVRFTGVRVLAMFLGLLAALLLVAESATADDAPPVITNGVLSPGSLPYEGGNVQISVDLIDEDGIGLSYATVYGSDGSYQAIQLYQGNLDTYYGTVEVPANYSDSPASYSVEVQATDSNNNYNANYIGDIQVEAAPQFDEYPYVSEATLMPPLLPPGGGTVTISAEASDNRGISEIFALIAGPGGTYSEVPLNAISFSRFEGTFAAPANSGPLAAEYLVEVIARDDIGQESRAIAGTATVEAPPPLSPGVLELSPDSRAFGTVKTGKTSQRLVHVRNLNRKPGAAVAAIARVSGSPEFKLSGASPEGLHFVLPPGQKRSFVVEFAPSVPGLQVGTLEVVRDDDRQSGLSVAMSGRGGR